MSQSIIYIEGCAATFVTGFWQTQIAATVSQHHFITQYKSICHNIFRRRFKSEDRTHINPLRTILVDAFFEPSSSVMRLGNSPGLGAEVDYGAISKFRVQ